MSVGGLCHSPKLGKDEGEGNCAISLVDISGWGLYHSTKLGRDQGEGDCAILPSLVEIKGRGTVPFYQAW
jgi:hypothetical protein